MSGNPSDGEDDEKAATSPAAVDSTALGLPDGSRMITAGMEQARVVEMQAVALAQSFAWGTLTNVTPPASLPEVSLLMQTVVELCPKTDDGHLIQAVTLSSCTLQIRFEPIHDPSGVVDHPWESPDTVTFLRVGYKDRLHTAFP